MDTHTPTVVGLGELLWDCFPDSRRPGGAPANVAFQANQLGCRGVVCSRVGANSDGNELLKFLQQQGLTTDFIQRDETLPTGRVTVDTAVPGSPQFVIHEDVAWDSLQFDPRVESLMRQARAVCFGTLGQRDARARETIQRCLTATSPGCLRVFDINLRQSFYNSEIIERSLELADIVKLNADETTVLRDLLSLPAEDADVLAAALCGRYGVTMTCITRAADGCRLFAGDEVADVPGRCVEVVDGRRCGGCLHGRTDIFARLQDWPLKSAAEFANGRRSADDDAQRCDAGSS